MKKRIQRNKAGGTDDLINEMILFLLCFSEGFTLIISCVNQGWRSEKLPHEWDIAKVIALFKGGTEYDRASRYRPISLLQAIYKIFTALIDNRLRQGLVERLHPQQFGFLKGHRVDHAIFGLLRAVQCAPNFQNLPLYILLLDWAKAYDTIKWDGLISAMERLGTPAKFVRMIRVLYSDPRFFVSDRFGSSSLRQMLQGLCQGDGLSICVLSVIFYDAERAWRQAGAQLADRERVLQAFGREVAKYADDSNLFSCDPAAL